ncbi:MAG TPA: hypothetical protein VFI60_04085 [Candidatus Acidoferrum sp.]|nr:hypothetical protein [Candidatus Acidoferrum sp.]
MPLPGPGHGDHWNRPLSLPYFGNYVLKTPIGQAVITKHDANIVAFYEFAGIGHRATQYRHKTIGNEDL